MSYRFKYLNCPVCGKQLIDLAEAEDSLYGAHYFWCDECNIDITIEEGED